MRTPRRPAGLLFSAIVACGLLEAACARRPETRPDILFVVIDTLRADRVGAFGYPHPTTPFLDSLAEKGFRFTNALTPLPATVPSHASMFTALHPLKHQVLKNGMGMPESPETLAEAFRRKGYHTMGAVAVSLLSRDCRFDLGFDAYSDRLGDVLDSTPQRAAPAVNRDVVGMLKSYRASAGRKPFFLFVHYFDPHRPYTQHGNLPEPVPGPKTEAPTARDLMIRDYDSEVRFADDHLRLLYGEIGRLGLSGKLVTCVTSDHGEQLGEHGFEGGHVDIYRETLRVPLIFSGPGIERGVRDDIVTSMDIPPTLLSLAGLKFRGSRDGKDLFRGRPAVAPAPLVCLGYPDYSRSVGLIAGRNYFIKNLDAHYRFLYLESPPGSATIVGKKRVAKLLEKSESGSLYPIPYPSAGRGLNSWHVSVTVRLKDPGIPARLSVGLWPMLSYFDEPEPFTGSIAVHYPVSRNDVTWVAIQPGDAVAEVVYRHLPSAPSFPDSTPGTGRLVRRTTAIYKGLLSWRKTGRRDELYDWVTDPKMIRNLARPGRSADPAPGFFEETAARWARLYRPPSIESLDVSYELKTLEALKSLGYVR